MARPQLLIFFVTAVCCTLYAQREATFTFPNGNTKTATFLQMQNDTVFVRITRNGQPEVRAFPKATFRRVVFGDGDTLDIRLSDYPQKPTVDTDWGDEGTVISAAPTHAKSTSSAQPQQDEVGSMKEGEIQYKYVYMLGIDNLIGQTAFLLHLKADLAPRFGIILGDMYMSQDMRYDDITTGTGMNIITAGFYLDVVDGLEKDLAGEIIKRKLGILLSATYIRFDMAYSYKEIPEELASNPYAAGLFDGNHRGFNGFSSELVLTVPIIQRIIFELRGDLGYVAESAYYDAGADLILIPFRAFPNMQLRLGAILKSIGGKDDNPATSLVAGASYGWGPFYRSMKLGADIQ